MKLTKQAADVLAWMPDWTAPYEIRDRRGHGRLPTIQNIARALAKRGLCEYSAANNTYRITDAGRAALEQG